MDLLSNSGERDFTVDEGKEQHIKVIRAIPHPKFDQPSSNNDIMLLELYRPARLTKNVRPICLPPRRFKRNRFDGDECVITGWGAIGLTPQGQGIRTPVRNFENFNASSLSIISYSLLL